MVFTFFFSSHIYNEMTQKMVFPTLAWSTYRYAKKSSLNEETDGLKRNTLVKFVEECRYGSCLVCIMVL